jgi:hypothetical protein
MENKAQTSMAKPSNVHMTEGAKRALAAYKAASTSTKPLSKGESKANKPKTEPKKDKAKEGASSKTTKSNGKKKTGPNKGNQNSKPTPKPKQVNKAAKQLNEVKLSPETEKAIKKHCDKMAKLWSRTGNSRPLSVSKRDKEESKSGSIPKIKDFKLNPLSCPELVTIDECHQLALKDAERLCTDKKDYAHYADLNEIAYHVLIHTWMYQWERHFAGSSMALLGAIRSKGLIAVINDCQTLATIAIRSNDTSPKDFTFVKVEDRTTDLRYLYDYIEHASTLANALQLLRYPKRFSPVGATAIDEKTKAAFLEINNRCKDSQGRLNMRCTLIHDVIHIVARHVESILGDRFFDVDPGDSNFSSGATAGAGKKLVEKLKALQQSEPALPETGIPLSDFNTVFKPVKKTVKGVVVPKSFKIGRFIAEEQPATLFKAQAVRKGMVNALYRSDGHLSFEPDDQETSKKLALNSSYLAPGYSSIDLSSASDSISVYIAEELLRYCPKAKAALRSIRAEWVELDKRVIKNHIWLTSGNPCTFNCEAIFFTAVCRAAKELYCSREGLDEDQILRERVYGDDILVDNRLFNLTITMLMILGMIPNVEKSFGPESAYREACGAEGVFGRDTSALYYPRTALNWEEKPAEAIATLVSLEKRLYKVPFARNYLITVVRAVEPRMTSHSYGTACSDMWEPVPKFKPLWAPYKGSFKADDEVHGLIKHLDNKSATFEPITLTMQDMMRREAHLVLTVRYPNVWDSDDEHRLLDAWHYHRFLIDGPTFDDDLSRVLGVSTKYDRRADYLIGEVVWSWTID